MWFIIVTMASLVDECTTWVDVVRREEGMEDTLQVQDCPHFSSEYSLSILLPVLTYSSVHSVVPIRLVRERSKQNKGIVIIKCTTIESIDLFVLFVTLFFSPVCLFACILGVTYSLILLEVKYVEEDDAWKQRQNGYEVWKQYNNSMYTWKALLSVLDNPLALDVVDSGGQWTFTQVYYTSPCITFLGIAHHIHRFHCVLCTGVVGIKQVYSLGAKEKTISAE